MSLKTSLPEQTRTTFDAEISFLQNVFVVGAVFLSAARGAVFSHPYTIELVHYLLDECLVCGDYPGPSPKAFPSASQPSKPSSKSAIIISSLGAVPAAYN
jgi:hypothetical protein